MKKAITAFILTASMVIALGACGGQSSSGTVESESGSETAAETAQSEGAAQSGETVQSEETETEAETEDPFIYAFDYDLSKYVKLMDYKGLEYIAAETSVSDEELQSYIDYILDASSTYEQITDRAAADGDTVVIDYTGRIDGKEFSGGSATDYELTLGSGTFIEGFEDGLIGVTPGETLTLDLKFPDDYFNEEYAGKAVSFETTVKYIEGELIVPELTDEFAAGLGIDGVKTEQQLREYLSSNLSREKESSASYSIQSTLLDQVVQGSEITEYPAEMLKVYVDSVTESVQEEIDAKAAEQDETLETAQTEETKETKETEKPLITDPDAYFKDMYGESIEDYCKETVKEMMVMCAIAQKEGIEITDDNFDQELETYAQKNKLGTADILKDQYRVNYLKLSMIYDRVLTKLQEYGKPVQATAETKAETEAGQK